MYVGLPTGKPHISFSELNAWDGCSWRHKLQQIDKIDISKGSQHMDFGTAVHAGVEQFLLTRSPAAIVFTVAMLRFFWDESEGLPGYERALPVTRKKTREVYYVDTLEIAIEEAKQILSEVPGFLEKTFPGWTTIDAEHKLYEPAGADRHPHAFKGFIDCVISVPNKKKTDIWILDAKTCGFGWTREKKQDPKVQRQLALYKHYYAKKLGIDLKKIKTGFLLLKRAAKNGSRCELVKTSAGPITIERNLKVVNNMFHAIKTGVAIKNRTSCQWCEYKNTQHCKGYVF